MNYQMMILAMITIPACATASRGALLAADGDVDHRTTTTSDGATACCKDGQGDCCRAGSLAAMQFAQTTTVGLQGFSPVSYLDDQKAEPGLPRFSVEHDGITYYFTSAAQRSRFVADPQRYLPAYGGYCAFGCAVNGKFTPDPTSFKIVDGRTLLFLRNADLDTKAMWEKENPVSVKKKADAFWASQARSRAYDGARNLPASGLALQGYSPVSYHTTGRAEHGDPRFQVEHNGAIYYLTSAAQVKQFKDDPARYEPAYGGWCALGMAVSDKFPVDPTNYKIVKGRLLLFLKNDGVDALKLWHKENESDLLAKADEYWKKVSGS